MKTKSFGIFEGGGAKGIAHAGALSAAEEELEFVGVAGTSAGAIIAALVAAGYNSREIYAPRESGALLSLDLTTLLVPDEWKIVKQFRDELDRHQKRAKERREKAHRSSRSGLLFVIALLFVALGLVVLWLGHPFLALFGFLFSGIAMAFRFRVFTKSLQWIGFWIYIHFLAFKYMRLVYRITTRGGALSTDQFRDWLNVKLLEKLRSREGFQPSGTDNSVAFSDLPLKLKIVASDAQSRSIRVFSSQSDGSMSVADAVCASISIPLAFIPKIINDVRYVDGGMMSNFPAWVFDDERKEMPRFTPTVGFRLVDEGDATRSNKGFEIWPHLMDVLQCALFGDGKLETRNIETLRELSCRTRVGVLEFDLSEERKEAAYYAAFNHARDGLVSGRFRPPSEKMSQVLSMVSAILQNEFTHKCHLRVSIMLPVDASSLQVTFSHGMGTESDTDDRLILGKDQGASGQCWRDLKPVLCDLKMAEESYSTYWNMDKYQQRLVRDKLKTLACIPLFTDHNCEAGVFAGTLNIDSDDDLLVPLGKLVADWQKKGGVIDNCRYLVEQSLHNWKYT